MVFGLKLELHHHFKWNCISAVTRAVRRLFSIVGIFHEFITKWNAIHTTEIESKIWRIMHFVVLCNVNSCFWLFKKENPQPKMLMRKIWRYLMKTVGLAIFGWIVTSLWNVWCGAMEVTWQKWKFSRFDASTNRKPTLVVQKYFAFVLWSTIRRDKINWKGF